MKQAEEILRMIEGVDPADTAKMDEIDAHFHFYLYPENLRHYESVGFYLAGVKESWRGGAKGLMKIHSPYTRSRDVLKAIRPKGWTWVASTQDHGCHFNFYSPNPNHMRVLSLPMQSDFLPTEELAELHAIIQAIAFEREKNGGAG